MKEKIPSYLARAKGAKVTDISGERIAWFVERAKRERDYAFSGGNSADDVLAQLVLQEGKHLLNAAVMLFGKQPQRYCPNAVVKCSHYHGIEVTRPIPSHQVFGNTLFEQVDAATDFVLSKLDRTISGRGKGSVAEARMEISNEAITEVIVNAVVHRDYDSNGSIQITIFADRVEVINPGRLPAELTVDDLPEKHLSIPVNPFLARPFYLAGYINQLGYGTRNVCEWCRDAHLPQPVFEQMNQKFSVTIWRNWLTEDRLAEFDLNDRQLAAVRYLKAHPTITNSTYQDVFSVAKRTASEDLRHLLSLGLVEKEGTTGKGVFYRIAKGASKGHKGHHESKHPGVRDDRNR